MELRDATFPDLEALLPLMRLAHANSMFAEIAMNEATVQRNFVIAIKFDQFAKVVEIDGEVMGGMFGVMGENQYGIRCAQDLFCFSRAGTDQLIYAYKKWAKERGAQFVQICDLSGNSRYQEIIAGLGFQPAGINFVEVA